jgi:hypothetical protein
MTPRSHPAVGSRRHPMIETTRPVNLARAAGVLAMCGIRYEVGSDGDLYFWIPPAEGDPAAFFGWLTCTDVSLAVYGGFEVLYDAGAGRINDLLIGYQREFWAPTGYSVEYEDGVRVYGRAAFHIAAGASDRQLVAWMVLGLGAVQEFARALHRGLCPPSPGGDDIVSAEELERWLDD